jgi:hypothetical protein
MFQPVPDPLTLSLFLLSTNAMPTRVLIVNVILGAQNLGDAISSEDKIVAKLNLIVVTYISY